MGDSREVHVDDNGKQFYFDEDGKRVYLKPASLGLNPAVQAAIVTGIFGIIIALIGLIPVNSSDEPYLPIFVAIVRLINDNEVEEPPSDPSPSPISTENPTNAATYTPIASFTSSAVPSNTTNVPPPSITSIGTATPTFTAPILETDHSNAITREQLNELFGENNWFCLGDRYADGVEIVSARNNGIGIKQQRLNVPLAYPIERLSNSNYPNGLDNGIASGGNFGSIADFTSQLYLSPDQCPEWQLEALEQWRLDRQSLGYLRPFDNTEITQFFGELAWNCHSYFSISGHLNDDYIVHYPVTFLSGNAHQRDFGIGETVPASSFQVTFWLNGSVESCE